MKILLWNIIFLMIYILCYELYCKHQIEKYADIPDLCLVYEFYSLTWTTIVLAVIYVLLTYMLIPNYINKLPKNIAWVLFCLGLTDIHYFSDKSPVSKKSMPTKSMSELTIFVLISISINILPMLIYIINVETPIVSAYVQIILMLLLGFLSALVSTFAKVKIYKTLTNSTIK